MISTHDRARLLDLARASLVARVCRVAPPAVPHDLSATGFGAFVTLYSRRELRGCVGQVELDTPLSVAVARLAAAVASEDPRFEPVTERDVPHVTLTISVLTPPQVVIDLHEIVVGRDGLLAEHNGRRGLLLPQVATEHRWDREALVAQTCLKAGLPEDAWRFGATLLRFEAEVFGDHALVVERG